MNASAMPAVCNGHGSPTKTLDANRCTAAWRAIGAAVPKRGGAAVTLPDDAPAEQTNT